MTCNTQDAAIVIVILEDFHTLAGALYDLAQGHDCDPDMRDWAMAYAACSPFDDPVVAELAFELGDCTDDEHPAAQALAGLWRRSFGRLSDAQVAVALAHIRLRLTMKGPWYER